MRHLILELIEVTLFHQVLEMEELLGRPEETDVPCLLESETSILGWPEQGLESDDATVLSEHAHLLHDALLVLA